MSWMSRARELVLLEKGISLDWSHLLIRIELSIHWKYLKNAKSTKFS